MTQSFETRALVLQGGGALGAYQAGAYEALAAAGETPDWVAGISIGAINAAIIAGNTLDDRSDRLRAFWDLVSSNLPGKPILPGTDARQWFNEWAAASALLRGIPGFFAPRIPLPLPFQSTSTATLGYYDTTPLQQTLESLIDFDLLNDGPTRLSVGAVNIETGNFAYFDTARQKLTTKHIMASGALPPGFPPVEIDGAYYWDGGLVSNTPLQYVLDMHEADQDICIFQVDLFAASGSRPSSMFDIAQREKDIRYSSRTRLNTDMAKQTVYLRKAARQLLKSLPKSERSTKEAKQLSAMTEGSSVTIVHLIHRPESTDTQSKDYEFSRLSVNEHWATGCDDAETSLTHPKWKARTIPEDGIQVFDLTGTGLSKKDRQT